MDNKGYYKLLGLSPGASVEAAKKAYNEMVKRYHPDLGVLTKKAKNIQNEEERKKRLEEIHERCKKLNDAKEVLTNKEKKQLYDQGLDENASYDMSGMGSMSDIFEFMSGKRSSGPSKVDDTRVNVKFTLKDSFMGRNKTFNVRRKVMCTECEGRGGAHSRTCGTCKGRGEVAKKKQIGIMFTVSREACYECRGSGQVTEGPLCNACKGHRYQQKQESMTITFEKGFKDGEAVVVRGKGDEQVGCIAGDLVFVISIRDDPHFRRVGNHLVTTADVHLSMALLGGTLTLRHINDSILSIKMDRIKDLREDVIIVKGEGFPGGDLYIIPHYVYGNVDEEQLKKVVPPPPTVHKNGHPQRSSMQGKMPSEDRKEEGRSYSFGDTIFSQFFGGL